MLAGQGRAGFVNGGFEAGDFTGWTLEHGTANGGAINFTSGSAGHAYVVGPLEDPYSPFDAPFFGSYMARINETTANADATRISQTAIMGAGETDLYIIWGAVLNDARHAANEQPFFEILIRKNGAVIAQEAFNVDYLLTHGSASASGFYYHSGQFNVGGFVEGDSVEIMLTAADCSQGGHSGYAYLDGIGTVAPPSEIGVAQSGAELTDGFSSLGYEAALLGNRGTTKTFTIRNDGLGDLKNLAVTATGTGAGSFLVGGLGQTQLAAGASTTFNVTFHPVATGDQTAILQILSNDDDEAPFDIGLTGNGLGSLHPFFPNASSFAFTSDGFSAAGLELITPNLAFAPALGSTLTLLDNTGTMPVTGTFIGLPEGAVIDALFGDLIYQFQIGYTGGTGNDIVLVRVDPEIAVVPGIGGFPPYTSGVSVDDFGSLDPGASFHTSYTIQNTGLGNLTDIVVSVEGPHAGDFTVSAGPAPSVPSGGSSSFTLTFSPLGSGSRNATLIIRSNDSDEPEFEIGLTGEGSVTLPDAVDNPGWTLSNTGYVPWAGQTAVNHDGLDAGRSGPIANNQYSTMDTTVTGPGVLTFWWKVSSEANYDYMEFYIDGVSQRDRISGEVDWQQKSYSFGSGSHTLSWNYIKDDSQASGADAAWVDQIVWTPSSATLPEAIDNSAWSISNTGYVPWFGQTTTKHDGVDAGQSGPIVDNQYSRMETTVEGSGTVSFWWKVSSEEGHDYMEFHIDGVAQKDRISGEVGWQQKTYSLGGGSHTLGWNYTKDGNGSSGTDAAWVDQVVWTPSSATLPEAIDNPAWNISNTGYVPWFGQTTTTHDGADAGQSGPIVDNQYSRMETTVQGAGTMSFWWKVSSEANYDYLEFYIDGVPQKDRISGEVGWQQKTYNFGAGSHTLSWNYTKDGSGTTGVDAAWLDQVVWTPSSAPLPEAIDNPAWNMSNTGYVPWFGQTTTTHDGTDAGQSGLLSDNQYSRMETIVQGPGIVSFWWKVSSEANYDYLEFYIDGTSQRDRISGEAGWQQKSYSLAAGSHTLAWNYIKDGSLASGADAGWVDQVVWIPSSAALPEAIDNPAWSVSNTGYVPWFGQTTTKHDGVDAGQSGPIVDNQYSRMETTVQGPGTVSFWWKVSSEANYDYMEFYIDGVPQRNRISGEVDWQQKTYSLAAGSHTLGWNYIKDSSRASGADAAWVDQVVLSPSTLEESIDNPAWTVANTGHVPWFGQTTTTHDGTDAGQSGIIAAGQYSRMETTVLGPGIVSFWWKVSSEAGYDYLEFSIDGAPQKDRISGEVGWQQKTYNLAAGSHTLGWNYIKDGSGVSGADAAWVDQIAFAQPGGFSTWASTMFTPGQLADTSFSGRMADANRDGITNLLAFAFNLHPLQPGPKYLARVTGTSGLPAFGLVVGGGKRLALEYVRRKASSNPGVVYTPQFSVDCKSWENATGTEVLESIDEVWERVIIEDSAVGQPVRLGRVMVTEP